MENRKHIIRMGVILFMLLAVPAMSVQAEKVVPYVDSFHLDVETLELDPGQAYAFNVVYEPENTMFDYLNWVTTDADVVSMEENTVRALTPGKVWLYAETFDHSCSKIVEVTVKGEPSPNRSESKGGESFMLLTERDVAKIEDPGFASYVNFIRQLGERKDPAFFGKIEHPSYSLYFDVAPEGHPDFMSRAKMLGLEDVNEFNYSDEIVVSGSADKLAALMAGNRAVLSVRTNELLFTVEPETTDTAKGITLQGNADVLSNFSAAHAAGLEGDGAVVAILDTGINASHEFFKNDDGSSRVAYQQCYSTTAGDSTVSVCKDGAQSADGDAYPYLPEDVPYTLLYNFSHGTHVAGIAAGNGGVAPKAKVAMVAVFSLIYKDGKPYTSGSYNSDLSRGLEKILEWYDNGANIKAVNLSLGSYAKGSTSYCDSTYPSIFHLFEELNNRGIQISVSSGNERYYADYQSGWIGWPACYSNVTTVGALSDSETPQVARFSNHGELVDILAPGSYIKSAVINDHGTYGTMSGTSQAAPMVAGTFALSAGHLGLQADSGLLDTLIAMSTKSAEADLVTKPVLDLTHIADYELGQPANLNVEFTENLTGGNVSGAVSWDAAAYAEGYEFSYKQCAGVDWITLENDLLTVYTIASLDPDKAYDVRVRAWRADPAGTGRLYSEFCEFSFSKNLSCPECLSVSVFGNVISLTWAVSPLAESYTVYYRESGTSEWASSNTTETSWMISDGIESGKTYELKVSARNADAEAESEIQTLSTAALWQPDAQVSLSTWDYSLATLKWTEVPGASGYRVSRRGIDESVWRDEQLVQDTVLTYSDLDGSEMVFQVCALFSGGQESCSTVSLPELPMEAKTVIDFEISITAEAGVVTLSWPAAADADGYIVYLYDPDTDTWVNIADVTEAMVSMRFVIIPDDSLLYGIRPMKVSNGVTMVPDEMLTFELKPDMLLRSESSSVSLNLDEVNPQPPAFFLLESPYRESFLQLPSTGFATGSARGRELRASLQNFRPTGYTLQIPTLEVMTEVVEVPFDAGQYSVTSLENKTGLLEGSSLPGKGISVLTGHNHLSASESGPFLLIRDLKIGDVLFVTDPAGELQVFSVYQNMLTVPNNPAAVEAELRENALVLITCENETAAGTYANRRVILAEPR